MLIIPDAALNSPALVHRSKDYPTRFNNRVPLKIRMLKTVTSDIPMATDFIAVEGREYYCNVNSHGAISAILPAGKELGIKPNEAQIIQWHNKEN